MTKRIAVVGSKGFIGARLVNALRGAGHEVIELDLPHIDISTFSPDDLVFGEVLSKIHTFSEVLEGVDVLFHLAVMNLEHCKKDYRGCIATNILGTASIMEVVRKARIKRVIYTSASSVYGDPVKLPAAESDPTMPLTLYGATKLASEKVIHAYSNNFDLTYGIFRFTNVYGPGQVNGLIPTVIQNLIKGEEISITGTGEQTRDFVYVDDVVTILRRAVDHPMYSFVSNLGSGNNISVNCVVNMCARVLDIEPLIKYAPMQEDRNEFQADLTEFKRLFGEYEFRRFVDGLVDTVVWWESKGAGH
ncbi:MAG: NAD-dependent epimerase/dehydratase family protein [Candidatus Methanoperedens sp.]|nr:NAD-dependent epimerase/dehydratase family protein [Candidatus Methanoperedens sp.]